MRSQYSYQVFFLIPLMFVVLLILLPLPLPPPLPLPLPLLPLSLPLEFAGVSSAALPVIVRTLDAWRRSQATPLTTKRRAAVPPGVPWSGPLNAARKAAYAATSSATERPTIAASTSAASNSTDADALAQRRAGSSTGRNRASHRRQAWPASSRAAASSMGALLGGMWRRRETGQ